MAAAHYHQLVMHGHGPPPVINQGMIPPNGMSITNSFVVDVPFLNSSYRVHPRDSGANLARLLHPIDIPLNRLLMLCHGYWIGLHLELGNLPGIRDIFTIDIGRATADFPQFPLPPIEQGVRYTLNIDVPYENDIACIELLGILHAPLIGQFGPNIAVSIRDKQRILHPPPGLHNNNPPPNPPPNNQGQDPLNNPDPPPNPPPNNQGQDPLNNPDPPPNPPPTRPPTRPPTIRVKIP